MEVQHKISMVSLHKSMAKVLKCDMESPNTDERYREHLFQVFQDVKGIEKNALQKTVETKLFFWCVELPQEYWYANWQIEKCDYYCERTKAVSSDFASAYLHYVSDMINASIAIYADHEIEPMLSASVQNPFKVIRIGFDCENLSFHPLLDEQSGCFMSGDTAYLQESLIRDSVSVNHEELGQYLDGTEVPSIHDDNSFWGDVSSIKMGN